MAIFHFSTKIISRSKGQSAVACAAYRSGEKLYDERYDKAQDYTRKEDIEHAEIILPDGAPRWMKEREKLWNHVERTELRKDSRLAREYEIALPREMTPEQYKTLIREFTLEQFTTKGLVVDLAIHNGTASDGCKQPHAHLLVIERELERNGFGKKYRGLNSIENLCSLRKEFANMANHHLALNGHDLRIDHRSLKEQGIDLAPQTKLGPTGSFHRMGAYQDYLANMRQNGEKLLINPEMVLDILTKQQATFTHHDIAKIVSRYTVDGEQFLNVYEKVKASTELVLLGKDEHNQGRFTTKDMIWLESEMVAHAKQMHEKEGHSCAEIGLEGIAQKHGLSQEQHTVLNYLTAKGDLKNVVGYPGTGKSKLLGAAREIWKEAGYRVLGTSLSGIAAENLENSSGIPGRTLASFIYHWDKGQETLTSKDILVVDEAGMLGTRQLAEVMFDAAKNGAKVVLAGDPQEQLQAIEAGAAHRGIIEHTSQIKLTEIWRQKLDWQKEATVQFSTRKTEEGIAQYAMHHCVRAFETERQAKDAIITAWNNARTEAPDKTYIILAFTRNEVYDLNLAARSVRQSNGELGQEHLVLTERGERQFSEGETIYFLKRNCQLGVNNGTLGTIVKINKDMLTVNVGKDIARPREVQFSAKQYNHLDYGYASTVHKGQGGTFDRSFVLASPYLDRQATNVAMTRHRESAELFWSKEVFTDYKRMVGLLSRDGSKDLTMDYLNDYEKASFALYRGMDTLWDTFWEKHGAQWLEKIKGTFSTCIDSTKQYINNFQEKISSHTQGLQKNDKWLDEMRAWVEETFGKRDIKPIGQEKLMEQATQKNSNITDKPLSFDELRAQNEERYQKIMKNIEICDTKLEKKCSLQTVEKENSTQLERTKFKEPDREIDF